MRALLAGLTPPNGRHGRQMQREDEMTCCWCGGSVQLQAHQARVINPQVDFPHALYRCTACRAWSLATEWGHRRYTYRAVPLRRMLLPTTYIVLYPTTCAWCGATNDMQAIEVNATIANPASQRHHYDIYGCTTCGHYTAVSYAGELTSYPATRDHTYPTLYHLQIEKQTTRTAFHP